MNIKGFENYNIDKLFNYYLKYTSCLQIKESIIRKLISVFYAVLFRNIGLIYEKHEAKARILFFDHGDRRQDIVSLFKSIQSAVPVDKFDIIGFKRELSFNLRRTIDNMCYACFWLKVLKGNYRFVQLLHIIRMLILFKDIEHEFNKLIPLSQYHLFVVLYDAETVQNFMSQFIQLHGCKVATLQHGIMISKRRGLEHILDFAGIEFESFVSNYFLAWNDFTREEAIKSGIPSEKIEVLGVVKCLGKNIIKPNTVEKKIGVILDGICNEKNNIPMLKIVNNYAHEYGYVYTVRYHPNFKGSEYSDYIDCTIGRICPKNVTLDDFIADSSFIVLSNSTVLFELEYHDFPFVRYSSHDLTDKYIDYPISSFETKDEMHSRLLAISHVDGKNDCLKAYALFFKRFID